MQVGTSLAAVHASYHNSARPKEQLCVPWLDSLLQCNQSVQQLSKRQDSSSEVSRHTLFSQLSSLAMLPLSICRGCNEPTAHTACISKRQVPLCPRCQGKYTAMVTGSYPPNTGAVDPAVEPLHYWLPRLLAPVARLPEPQRRDFCDMLVLRQDDAWLHLIQNS